VKRIKKKQRQRRQWVIVKLPNAIILKPSNFILKLLPLIPPMQSFMLIGNNKRERKCRIFMLLIVLPHTVNKETMKRQSKMQRRHWKLILNTAKLTVVWGKRLSVFLQRRMLNFYFSKAMLTFA
jgi:hypothetical protein